MQTYPAVLITIVDLLVWIYCLIDSVKLHAQVPTSSACDKETWPYGFRDKLEVWGSADVHLSRDHIHRCNSLSKPIGKLIIYLVKQSGTLSFLACNKKKLKQM